MACCHILAELSSACCALQMWTNPERSPGHPTGAAEASASAALRRSSTFASALHLKSGSDSGSTRASSPSGSSRGGPAAGGHSLHGRSLSDGQGSVMTVSAASEHGGLEGTSKYPPMGRGHPITPPSVGRPRDPGSKGAGGLPSPGYAASGRSTPPLGRTPSSKSANAATAPSGWGGWGLGIPSILSSLLGTTDSVPISDTK